MGRSRAPKQEPQHRRERQAPPKKKKEKIDVITQYTQDFIPIKDIKNGIIELTDGRFIKILEIEPINFSLRSGEEKNNIIYNFACLLRVSNVRLQFKSIAKQADSEKYINIIKRDMSTETDENLKNLARENIKLIRTTATSNAVTRRFFLIMEYEPMNGKVSHEYMEIYQSLQYAAMTAKNYFHNCGNSIVQAKNEDQHVGEILYILLNRRSSIEEPFQSRVQRVIKDTMKAKNRMLGRDEIPAIPVVNYIAPRGLKFDKPDYVVMDGLYYTYIYLKGKNGYRLYESGGWASSLVNMGEGVDIDIHFQRLDRNKYKNMIAQKIKFGMIDIGHKNEADTGLEELDNMLSSARYMKSQLANDDDIFYMSTIITISAPTLEGLRMKKDMIVKALEGEQMYTGSCIFCMEEAFLSTLPILKLDKSIERKARRNVLTDGAASTYMFTSFEMCDDDGVLFGINEMNASLCIIDQFNSKQYKNANMCIIGTSGAGKTYTTQLIALRMRLKGIQVFIIAPLKGNEFRRACNYINGTFIEISSASPQCINIMEIRKTDDASMKLIEGEENIMEGSKLAQKIGQLHKFFSLLIPEMTNEEQQLLDEAIVETYAQFGITNDNESLFIPGTDQYRKMPIIGDLYEVLLQNEATRSLAIIVNRFVNGSASGFNKQTNVNLDNKYIVIDVSKLTDVLQTVGMFIAMDIIWDKAKEDVTKKKAIIIDEAWRMIGEQSTPEVAGMILEIFKIIRGYGGSAIVTTQDLYDFFALEDGKYGKGIINSCKTKIILQLEPQEAKFVQSIFKFSKRERQKIVNFGKGHALLCSNNNKVQVVIRSSELEDSLITTDRAQLAAMAQKKKDEELKKEKQRREQEKQKNAQ